MAEIEYWRDRSVSLAGLDEQLSTPIAKKILKILLISQSYNATALDTQLAELAKCHSESKDNIKFLTTLERHFKNIVTGTLGSIQVQLQSND